MGDGNCRRIHDSNITHQECSRLVGSTVASAIVAVVSVVAIIPIIAVVSVIPILLRSTSAIRAFVVRISWLGTGVAHRSTITWIARVGWLWCRRLWCWWLWCWWLRWWWRGRC